jgi:hypothetical protein
MSMTEQTEQSNNPHPGTASAEDIALAGAEADRENRDTAAQAILDGDIDQETGEHADEVLEEIEADEGDVIESLQLRITALDRVAESRIKRNTAEHRILQQAMMNHRLLQTLAAVAQRHPESQCWTISDFDLGMAQNGAWKQWVEAVQGPNAGGVT